jgi:prevent-host-death family protein
MLSAGIKDLKNNLSRYLSLVKQGEEILITERGRIIARIIQERSKGIPITEALRPLVDRGLVTLPSQRLDRDIPDPIEVPGKPLSQIVIEDRR